MKKKPSKNFRKHRHLTEVEKSVEEIQLLDSWIESGKPDSGSNPLSIKPTPSDAPVGRLNGNRFSPYAGCRIFTQLPISKKTKDGLREAKFTKMTAIQTASLPHSLCGRDILGAAKTGSGKTLAFIIPVLEKLYKSRWGPEDGVGCIIMSPTRELASQLFEVLKVVGRHHGFSAGLLIGGRDVDTEKEHVNDLNILICTPGRLLQHMDETPNFDCSQIQVLVLDEADNILDKGFKKTVNAIISQLPKQRQTLLFSATQTKKVEDLARLSLKDPEYISVHEEAPTATPTRLKQKVIIVPLEQKFDMLWSFIKKNLNSRILVFLSSCKQVRFAFEAFKKLRPGIPVKCLHGRMKQEVRLGIYAQFCEKKSVLFSTDVASRGLDFNKAVDWVVQVDCPENVAGYIHRAGRTARFFSAGNSLLFLLPSEMKMFEKLRDSKIPIELTKANKKWLQPVSGSLAALLVKYPNLQPLAERAFITYLKSIHKQGDKEVFDVTKLPIDEYAASLGLPMTPRVRFINHKTKDKMESKESIILPEVPAEKDVINVSRESSVSEDSEQETEPCIFPKKEVMEEKASEDVNVGPMTRVLKKKKLKINIHRPVGTRYVFDDEGNTLPPLATIAEASTNDAALDKDKVSKRYADMREQMKLADKEDKLLDRQRRKEKRLKEKKKLKRARDEEKEEDQDEDDSHSKPAKRSKVYFDSESDEEETKNGKAETGVNTDTITLAEQEALALKLLSSMHS